MLVAPYWAGRDYLWKAPGCPTLFKLSDLQLSVKQRHALFQGPMRQTRTKIKWRIISLISARRFQIFHFKFQHISTQILPAAFVRGNISIPEKRFWAQAQKQRLVEQVETWTLNLNPQGPQGCCWSYVVFKKQKTGQFRYTQEIHCTFIPI